jgi:hypothetical protein
MKSMARSILALFALIAFTGWSMSLAFSSPAEKHALFVSAVLAATVQIGAFGLVRLAGRDKALFAWGIGTIFRGIVLIIYGFFLLKLLHLPHTAALVSFAVFLFVSMLLESTLLAYDA